MATTLVRSE